MLNGRHDMTADRTEGLFESCLTCCMQPMQLLLSQPDVEGIEILLKLLRLTGCDDR